MPDTPLPPDLQFLLDAELRPSETVLWAVQPSPVRMARLARPQFLMGIYVTLFASLWESIVLTMFFGPVLRHGTALTPRVGMAILFPLVGAMVLVSGIHQLLSPVRQRRQAQQTVYAVTNERALVLQGGRWNGTADARLLPPEQIRNRSRTQQRDGSGDILFPGAGSMDADNFVDRYFAAASRQLPSPPLGFYGIPDVRGVDDLIGQTFDGTPPTRTP